MNNPIATLEPQAASLVSVDGKSYPLTSASLAARAAGGFALSTLAQAFENPHDEPLEVLYTLPLPADGAVLGYTVSIGETTIRGEVQPREQAERAYRDALYAGRTAGLLEQSRIDTFQQRLGNVPPRTRVEIAIDVLHPLVFVPGTQGAPAAHERDAVRGPGGEPVWEYRFPTVVGVRYVGAQGRVPDAGELSPDRGAAGSIPATCSFSLAIEDSVATGACCASHACDALRDERGTRLTSRAGERLDRDIVARWTTCAAEVGVSVVEGAGLPGDDGRYALVTLVPPAAPRATWARDLTVLIDASGSMSGQPLELAVRVSSELLRSLGAGDRFELLAFANDVRPLTHGLHVWNERELAHALEALSRLQAGGGTEMVSAVRAALATHRDAAQRQVVLVTDGQIGFEAGVVARITGSANVRLHAVGVGAAPNRALTQQAAAAGRGVEILVSDERDAHAAAARLVAATARPVLTGITVGGTAITGVAPAALRDVCAGQPLAFTVELSPGGGTLVVRGDLAGADTPWAVTLDVPAAGAPNALAATPLPLGALYGRERIGELELRIASERDARGLDQRIESLGMRHKIASRRTSLVAIAEEPGVDPKLPRRRERLAVELPYGVSAEGVGFGELAYGTSGTAYAFGSALMASRAMPPRASGRPAALRPAASAPDAAAMEPSRRMGAPSWKRGMPDGLQGRRGRSRRRHDAHATVVRRTESTLVLEIEVPFDGFELPADRVWLETACGRCEASIVVEAGSGPGPFAAGTLVRLVVEHGAAWGAQPTAPVSLQWSGGEVAFELPPREAGA